MTKLMLITLLYSQNKIKFNIGKKRNSSNDFITSQKHQKVCNKRNVKRFILVIDNASSHVSKKTTGYVEIQAEWLTVVYLPKGSPFLNHVKTRINRNLKKDICANYCYETEEDLLCSVRKYLRRTGCWPTI